jgi:hypothetical protein
MRFLIKSQKENAMKINGKWKGVLVAWLLAMMVSPVLARENRDSTPQFLPQVMHQEGISYTSGGYGLNERGALEATAKKYDLIISNADKKGEFTAGTKFVITNKGNHKTLTVKDTGPLFYAKLPAGTYVIKAVNDDRKVERTISIMSKKQDKIHLIWPS